MMRRFSSPNRIRHFKSDIIFFCSVEYDVSKKFTECPRSLQILGLVLLKICVNGTVVKIQLQQKSLSYLYQNWTLVSVLNAET